MKKIAILGATGHIGKALTYSLSLKSGFEVFLFARSMDRLQLFLSEIRADDKFHPYPIKKFGDDSYDVVVNCVGFGSLPVAKDAGADVFKVTEDFDNLILEYIRKRAKTLYVSLSSGAVYGKSFALPVDEHTKTILDVNNISYDDYYSVAKINSEFKHRLASNLNIVDLRIFSFFSRFLGMDSGLFMSEIIASIKKKRVLMTSSEDILRDYIASEDLLELIVLCSKKRSINDFFDVYSKAPVTKRELLEYFKREYGLKYLIKNSSSIHGRTGSKYAYYSINRKAKALRYSPKLSSMDCIMSEAKKIL